MLIDARELLDGHVIEADIAIVGGGAAGITLGCELAASGHSVALLESGGLEHDPQIQQLNDGVSVGLEAPPLTASRLRFFGGTTNHWTGQCGPLDSLDFEVRDWVPHSGWPITRADLDPFYERALPYCQLGPMSAFDAPAMRAELGVPSLGLDPADFRPLIYQMSPPTRFGEVWRARLQDAPRVQVYLYANVIEMMASEAADRIVELRCGTLSGRRFTARAQRYVLATGGIENARVLLASRSVAPSGLGNRHDLVGRFFMNHFNVEGAGQVIFGQPERVDARFHTFWRLGDIRGRGGLRVPAERLRRERIVNSAIVLWPEVANENHRELPRTDGVEAFIGVTRSLAARNVPDDFWRQTCLAVNDRRSVATFVKRRVLRRVQDSGGTVHARLQMESEQSPNPDSRVTLTEDRDAFGVSRVRLDWQPTTLDIASIRRTLEIFGLAVGAAGLGRYHADWSIAEDDPPGLTSTFHHMGTTRMGTDVRASVVDPDCRLHDVHNLYVAGSSVFPTSGRSNPTLTIVALAIRLADHLKQVTARA